MNLRRSDRPADRAETERLLDAARAGGSADPAGPPPLRAATPAAASTSPSEPLARLLAAAAAPAKPGELAGEQAALAAFRAARADPAPASARRPHRRRLTTAAIAWLTALAASATAGVAFAAVSLNRPADPPAPARTSVAPTPTDRTAGPSGSGDGTPSGEGTPSGTDPSRSAGSASAGPSTSPGSGDDPAPAGQLTGLCGAWLAKTPDQRDKALGTPAFARLVSAAGSAGDVEAYCRRLVPEAKPTASPPTGARPTASPPSGARPTASPPTEPKPKPETSEPARSAKATPSKPGKGGHTGR
ncbi:hypothetical protein ACFOW4_03555 [Micromonospora sp. GCM10011542]|uniref:hypothetical protein n=1 Tax=Micromonospora sp. GCM10011542 TaxID=3317337 RepID=UPI0036077950